MEEKTINNKRIYGIDIARIIAIFLIIVSHSLNQGGIRLNCAPGTSQYIVCNIMEVIAYGSIDLFAIVSGYVGLNSKYSVSRIIKLWITVVFYSLLFTIIFSFIQPESVTISRWIMAFLPVVTKQYWYFTQYFCLFIFIPLLNKGTKELDNKQCNVLLMVIMFFFTIVQILFGEFFYTNSGYSAIWLIIMYITGAIIKKNNLFSKMKNSSIIITYILYISLVVVFSSYLFSLGTTEVNIQMFFNRQELFYNFVSFSIVWSYICFLILYLRISVKEKYRKIIRSVSSTTFSIYIIHAHPLLYNFMKSKFSFASNWNHCFIVLFVLCVAVLVFLLCYLIDRVRVFIFNKIRINEYIDYVVNRRINI